MRLSSGLAFCAGLAIAASLAVLDRHVWFRYTTALQSTVCLKGDKR